MDRLFRLRARLARHRTALTAAGALAFGALAVVGANDYIGERLAVERARLQPRHEAIEVVVARRDLKRGELVGPDTMAVRSVPRDLAPGAAIVPDGFDAVAGGRLLVAMRSGEPLLPSAIASPEAGAISGRVRPGIRAMTIAVDEVNSLSGLLQPGDRIDLMLSVRPPPVDGVAQPEVTRTVMQGVAVLATGRQSRASGGEEAGFGRSFTSITVEVDPEQAQRLVVAQRSGKLTAVLRNPEDRARIEDRRLDVNALLGLPPPAPPRPPLRIAANPKPVTEVIVGGRGNVTQGAPQGAAPGSADAGGAAAPAGREAGAPVARPPEPSPIPGSGVAPPRDGRSAGGPPPAAAEALDALRSLIDPPAQPVLHR